MPMLPDPGTGQLPKALYPNLYLPTNSFVHLPNAFTAAAH
jgi:hypothetical protein